MTAVRIRAIYLRVCYVCCVCWTRRLRRKWWLLTVPDCTARVSRSINKSGHWCAGTEHRPVTCWNRAYKRYLLTRRNRHPNARPEARRLRRRKLRRRRQCSWYLRLRHMVDALAGRARETRVNAYTKWQPTGTYALKRGARVHDETNRIHSTRNALACASTNSQNP
jgi:hypothetical protein